MSKFQLQMLMQSEPIIDAIERAAIEFETGMSYDNWIADKRLNGLRKNNRPIDRKKRRQLIAKKHRGY